MLHEVCLYSDELEEAKLGSLRILLIDKSIMVRGPMDTDCWIWTGGVFGPGYGHVYWPGMRKEDTRQEEAAHRLSYMVFKGPIPEGLWVLHRCDVKLCVNPKHLYAGTSERNAQDREERRYKARALPLPCLPNFRPSWMRRWGQKMKLAQIISSIKHQVDEQIENAYKILGAKPGPGIDIVVYPATDKMSQTWLLSGQTKAGKAFIGKFWPDPLVRSNHQLGQFKRQAEEWGLKYRVIIKFEPISEVVHDP